MLTCIFYFLHFSSANVLLHGFKGATLDETSVAKVAGKHLVRRTPLHVSPFSFSLLTPLLPDFGTARTDDRNHDQLRTSAPTHAFTRQVAGTTPYMPSEYIQNGHVSEKTDAFAFGILVIEVLTNLSPSEARTLVDDHEITTLPNVLKNHAKSRAAGQSRRRSSLVRSPPRVPAAPSREQQ
jgi:serine/threonine protein kinase